MIQIKVDLSSLKIEEKTKELTSKGVDSIMRTVATSMLGVMKQRVFEQGKDSENSSIGEYNKTNPLYVNPNVAPRSFATKGKNGETKFKTGQKKGQQHLTRYFDSYNDYKTFIGRNQLGTVNLSLSGQMSNQFVVIAIGDSKYGLGWLNEEMFNRAEWFEKKYGKKIWDLTDNELKLVNEIVKEELPKYL